MLHGRGHELERVDSLLGSARAGDGGSLLLSGDAGIGKTALLRAARERAEGMRVIEVVGIEAESDLPFAAVTDLVEPVLGHLPGIAPPQRAALEGALALGPPVPGDRFAACAGAQSLLTAAAAEKPLLLLVDDAQWLDSASAECIGFLGRRLTGTPIAMLAASRTGEASRFEAAGFEQLAVSPLPPEHARELLRAVHSDLSEPATGAVIELAAGNPLALVELPAGLAPEQRSGDAELDPVLTPGDTLRGAFSGRLGPLDDAARLAVLVVAASGSRSLRPIVAACRELGLDEGALARAEAAGLVSIARNACEFSHPLLRGVAYGEAAPEMRRRVHLALAENVEEVERGWQLAAAAIGPDEGAARALERSAERVTERGAPIAAADALERASELSSEEPERIRRLVAAGQAASAGGMHDRAVVLLERAVAEAGTDQLGHAIGTLAMASLYGAHDAPEAYRMLDEQARTLVEAEPLRAATVFADAAVAAMVAGDCRLALQASERGEELLGDGGDATQRAQVLSILSWSLTLCGRGERGRALLGEVDRLLPEIDPFSPAAQSIALAINSRIPGEEYERARAECAGIVDGCREAGMIGMLPFPLSVEADACHRLGDWPAAERLADEAIALAEETGENGPLSQALVIRLWLLAGRGDERGSREAADRALAIARPAKHGAVEMFVLAGLGFLELGTGKIAEAIETLERLRGLAEERGFEEPTLVPWAPDLIEAYVQAGRAQDAESLKDALAAQAAGAGGAFARSLAARAEGLVSDDFDDAFAAALELDDERPVPFERARTELVWGVRLHRARRRVEARERLRAARAGFERLGAAPWIDRANAELRAAGAVDRDPVGDPDELTAQEVRVAKAVATGATNREVASELFLSPKTIEFHLSRVYRKLGISSRTELAGLVAEGGLDSAESREGARS